MKTDKITTSWTCGLSSLERTLTVGKESRSQKNTAKSNESLRKARAQGREHALFRNIFTTLFFITEGNSIFEHMLWPPVSMATSKDSTIQKGTYERLAENSTCITYTTRWFIWPMMLSRRSARTTANSSLATSSPTLNSRTILIRTMRRWMCALKETSTPNSRNWRPIASGRLGVRWTLTKESIHSKCMG